MPISSEEFRSALSRFASGVTVVTTRDDNGKFSGLTVSAFCSVSLEPPMVLVCIEKSAAGSAAISATGAFAVNFLNHEQQDLSDHFASPIEDRLRGNDYSIGELGLPLLSNCICNIECEVKQEYDGGDHTIFVGQVESSTVAEGDPLLYFRSGYRSLRD
jgi:flavin reductase (DIM6/NTAB) family NADH-FMN oxidoreductase RutF